MSAPSFSLSAKALRTGEAPINYLITLARDHPGLISFAPGLVDPLTLPGAETLAIAQRLLSSPASARDVLQYGTTAGVKPLREAIVRHIESLEGVPAETMSIKPDNVVVTTGSQQALYILADLLLDAGDIVILESPSYFVYTGALASFGARVIAVPMDRDGMVVEALDSTLHRLEAQGQLDRVKAIYCQSYFQNPTGLTLSLERRGRLVELARKYSKRHRILVIEDAAYRELRYEGADLPSVKRFDPDNQFVATCYTFDKPFAAGLKLGYAILPPELAGKVLEQKGNHDFGSSHLCQAICQEALTSGAYASHLEPVRANYRRKRDLMLGALHRSFPNAAESNVMWTEPQGGLYVWLSLPVRLSTARTSALFERALRSGVLYVPGEYCFQPDEKGHVPQNHMRLCYAVTPAEQIEPGMAKLASVIRESL